MTKFLLGMFAAVALATSAFAGDEVMASRFGNTTVVTTASGAVLKIWYNPDHTWTGDMGGPTSGTWKVDGNTLCVTYNNPPPGAVNPTCSPAMERKIGEHWTVGEGVAKLEVTLLAGHQ